jgi:hypothetical protein
VVGMVRGAAGMVARKGVNHVTDEPLERLVLDRLIVDLRIVVLKVAPHASGTDRVPGGAHPAAPGVHR